jgi:hypothetical protein
VLSDDLTEQQVNYFATPEGFANVANGKIDVSKMINDNMQRKSLEEKLGDNRPKLGSKRDAGKSVRKWRKSRGLDETDQVNEKSVRQAQFRTMAAAAHNPEFARKVGIKQSVAKEFNQADKGSNYKKLPDRTTEGAPVTTTPGSINPGGAVDNFKQQMANNTEVAYQKKLSGVGEGEQQKGADYRDPKEVNYDDDYDAMVSRVKKLAGLGPLKTVYDPAKRQYRNMPTAVQPKK